MGALGVGFWSEDGSTIYFNTGVRVTNQLHALDVPKWGGEADHG